MKNKVSFKQRKGFSAEVGFPDEVNFDFEYEIESLDSTYFITFGYDQLEDFPSIIRDQLSLIAAKKIMRKLGSCDRCTNDNYDYTLGEDDAMQVVVVIVELAC